MDSCSICLNSTDTSNTIKLPKCGHSFHQGCISSWLLENTSCPLCRCQVYEELPTPRQIISAKIIIQTDESNHSFSDETEDYITDLIISEKLGLPSLISWGVNGYGELYSIISKKKFRYLITCDIYHFNDIRYTVYTNIYIIDKKAQLSYQRHLQNIMCKNFKSASNQTVLNNYNMVI